MLNRRPLQALIAAELISSLGSLMTVVALPWFVLDTTGSPVRMSSVLAAESAALLLVGIPSSRLVARIGSRRALIVCDAVWAPVIALIPILHFAGALTFPMLVVLSFLAGVPWAAHSGSQSAVVPDLLGEDVGRVAQANALLQTLSRLAYFAGPALGGVLLAAFGAPTVLLIDAGSFVVSLLLVAAFIPAAEMRAAPVTISGGWRFIRRDAWMRPLTAAQALSQAAFMGMTAAIPVLAFATYDRNAKLAGLLLGVWGGGAMVGSMLAMRLVRWRDPYRLGTVAWTLQALPLWAILVSRSAGRGDRRARAVGSRQRRPRAADHRAHHAAHPTADQGRDDDGGKLARRRRRVLRTARVRPGARQPRHRRGLGRHRRAPDRRCRDLRPRGAAADR